MSFKKHYLAASVSAAALCMSGPAAIAQSSLSDVLGLLQSQGGTVEFADKSESGGAVEWTDVTISGPGGEVTVETAWLKETTSGSTIAVTIAPEATLTFRDGGEELAKVLMTNDGFIYAIDTSSNAISHSYTANTLTLERISGEFLTALDVSLTDFAGTHNAVIGPEVDVEGALAATALAAEYEVSDPSMSAATQYIVDDFAMSYAGAGPMMPPEMMESLAAITAKLNMTTGAVKGFSRFGQGAEEADVQFTGGSSSAVLDMEGGRLDYDTAAKDLSYTVSMAGLGFPPFDISASELTSGIGMPLAKADAPDDARVQMAFRDLTVSDGLWNMFDPASTLPRDPANVILDLTGSMKWLVEPMMAETVDMPVEVDSFALNDLTVEIAGAQVYGKGGAALDFSGPIPTGDGQINFVLKGVIGLSEKLAALGLAPPDVVMGARGMLGVFAIPKGEDHFESEIKMSPDGTVTANGMPLPL